VSVGVTLGAAVTVALGTAAVGAEVDDGAGGADGPDKPVPAAHAADASRAAVTSDASFAADGAGFLNGRS
jgi:hypothetical protein